MYVKDITRLFSNNYEIHYGLKNTQRRKRYKINQRSFSNVAMPIAFTNFLFFHFFPFKYFRKKKNFSAFPGNRLPADELVITTIITTTTITY